ncbi:hypothetical protein NLX83_24720 [Allokutzneria sp. A3M-2-11 16]|uniref:hypothetical protein n=1 Tax=Allokutzneria sp. A3M-2-11 16 TaxID=2962043 RepID=UPI0020B67CA4|nr:hypothetical protein [Allokutzneria sp. A3M-2-11 16]MCP3802478.1 hypothetical protein [Allokutzneria sp. A3M-2-11 16]
MGGLAPAAASAYSFSDRLVTLLAIVVAIAIAAVVLLPGEPWGCCGSRRQLVMSLRANLRTASSTKNVP